MSNIKILVAEHKPAYHIDNPLLLPVHVGAALSGANLGIQRDDDGQDNISTKNPNYCELTAIYWAWKNLDADYYGLFHYRRYLSFADATDEFTTKPYLSIKSAEQKIGIDQQTIEQVIAGVDAVVPRPEDVSKHRGESNAYLQYKKDHYIADLDICLEYIIEKYPDIAPHVQSVHEPYVYSYNMFVMKKTVFEEYCEYIFDVLRYFDTQSDISGYDSYQSRVDGFLAERLTSIFVYYLKARGDTVRELQTAFFECTEPHQTLASLKFRLLKPIRGVRRRMAG